MAKKAKVSEKFVYRFTGGVGKEEFPTLGRVFEEIGELHESDVAIDHPRLELVSGPKQEVPKQEEAQQDVQQEDTSPVEVDQPYGSATESDYAESKE